MNGAAVAAGWGPRAAVWVGYLLVTPLALLIGAMSVIRGWSSAQYLTGVLGTGPVDVWAVLSALELACAAIGIVASGWSLARRAFGAALLFVFLQLPVPVVIEANRCDRLPCTASDWARLPPAVFEWEMELPGRRHGAAGE